MSSRIATLCLKTQNNRLFQGSPISISRIICLLKAFPNARIIQGVTCLVSIFFPSYHFQTRECSMVWLLSSSRRLVFNQITFSASRLTLPQLGCLFTTGSMESEKSATTNGSSASPSIEDVGTKNNGETAVVTSVTAEMTTAPRADYPWRRAKKVACMLSFSGKDYFGMQRTPGMRTIEEELMAAFRNGHNAISWLF